MIRTKGFRGKSRMFVMFGVGLAAGWLIRSASLDSDTERRLPEPQSVAPREATAATIQSQRRPARTEALAPASTQSAPAEVQERSKENLSSRFNTKNPVLTGEPNNIFQAGKDRSLTDGDAGATQRLFSAVRISCEFGPGYAALWTNGQAGTHTASWQGGPIMYDQIAEGSALMLGNEGATGSSTGEVKVRVAATKTGLHFSSFVPRGDLISTTVFAALDEKQRFIAVMSTHASEFNHNSSQFHGACDVLY